MKNNKKILMMMVVSSFILFSCSDEKTSMERWTDLDTRQGRMIFLGISYNPNSKKLEIDKEKQL